MNDQIRIGDEWYVTATAARAEESPQVIKSGDTFGLFDRFGDIRSWGLGELGDVDKNELLGSARALLFPVDWPEPFGLVMIEAMACGTPVVAYDCGSVPEVLQHGVTGYVVRNQEEAIAAAQGIGRLDRCACRAQFEQRFTADRMVQDTLEVYQRLRA